MNPDDLVRVPFETHIERWKFGARNRHDRLTFVNAIIAHFMAGTALQVDSIEEHLGPSVESHPMPVGTLRVYLYWDYDGCQETEWVLLVSGEAGRVIDVTGNERRSFKFDK